MTTKHISEYPQLLNAVLSCQKIVYLCGAGASMSLGDHGLGWGNWILAGKKYLLLPEQNELDRRIGTWTSKELIDAVTYLFNQLKASGSYEAFMNQTIGSLHPVNTEFKDALLKIWRAGDLLATTNYDMQIEETLDVDGISYSSPSDILFVIRSTTENKVIHLHGMYDCRYGIDDIIADGPQYRDVLNNSGAQFIQNLLGTYPIIIVGCGGTMEDPNLSGFISFVTEKLGTTAIPYFFLVKNGDTMPDLPANAIPVFYGDDYADLPAFLSEIAVSRLQRRAGLRSIVSVDPYQSHNVATSAFGRMHFANGFNPFVGRTPEMNGLNTFLQSKDKFSWWSVLGEGGIGKSRLILEWMKAMPPNWFCFFSKKKAEAAYQFIPFTDTVVAFDYVLGQERQCADTIAAFVEVFADSPYKLRIVLLERHRQTSDNDWLIVLKREMSAEARIEFEAGVYSEPMMTLGRLDEADEIAYIENYLNAYLPLLETSRFIEGCKSDTLATAKRIHTVFRTSMDAACLRPLFLSVFIEVWLAKEGQTNLTSTEELLSEYLNKEKIRWKCILKDDSMVDSYLRILAVACIVKSFNITDVHGTNYLEEDCKKLVSFFDARSGRPGANNLFEDLFVTMSEQADETESALLTNELFHEMVEEVQETENAEATLKLDRDERFALLAPYIKLDADPQEVYLNMLVGADAATEEEKQELVQIRERRIQKEKMLPDHAWFLEPCFPDIINEYIVAYAVNERDAVRFTKLVRSNSIMDLADFIPLALDDWPENKVFQKISVTPPDEELNYMDYYCGLLPCIAAVKDIKAVENALLESDPIFQRYELELWRRIAIVLTDRGDVERLFDSSCNFIRYVKETAEKMEVRDETADVLEAYCVGIHNAEAVDKYDSFLKKCSELNRLLPDCRRIALLCCENYRLLMHLRIYKDRNAEIREDWYAIKEILELNGYDEVMCRDAMKAAEKYFHSLLARKRYDELSELEYFVAEVFRNTRICEAAEISALCLANLYSGERRRKMTTDAYERIKKYWSVFPDSMHIRAAFVKASDAFYSPSAEYERVPHKIINYAKNWSVQYPGEIEFQEGYFGLLFSRLKYAQMHDMRNEQRRVFHEMKIVAERADYSEYNESNQLKEAVEMIQMIFGY